ncbi:MAG: DDE-type integrase/transposase/recombinase, partial [Methanoculleaceae archaeon]
MRFKDLCRAAETFGFRRKGGKGSHTVYVRDGIPDILNFQNVKGKAKPYQVRQLLKMISINGQDRWLIAFMDDSSRLITCYGVFDRPTTEYTIQVLEQGFLDYGTPREILTDNGS